MDRDLELMRQMRRCGHILYHRSDMNQSQNRILMLLARHGPMSQKALTERMHIQPGSLSEVLAKVEHAGYIEKHRSGEDGRKFELRLTAQGAQQAEAFALKQSETARMLFAPLDDAQKETLGGILTELLGSWDVLRREDTCEKE